VAGRTRPFKLDAFDANGDLTAAPFALQPFRGGLGRMFDSQNLSFPSGHAALAFATATALAALFPRWRWAFYAMATACAAERVLENAHWVSDALGAAALGIGGVTLLRRVVTGLEERARARRDAVRPSLAADGTAAS
jgi:membrane-associated phospholipid phosphatase